MDKNIIYKILEGNKIDAIVLFGNHPKEMIEKFKDAAINMKLKFVNINDNVYDIHKLLTVDNNYSELLNKNDAIYEYKYDDVASFLDYLEAENFKYLASYALMRGNFKNVKSVIKAVKKIGHIDLKVPKERENVEPISISLIDVIDECPSIYINGNGDNIIKIVRFLEKKKLTHLLQMCPTILLNKFENVEDIYNFFKNNKKISIVKEAPIVLTASSSASVKNLYDYGTKNDCFSKCPSLVTYKEENVAANDKILSEYNLNKTIAVSIMQNNPNKLVKMIDLCIESNAFNALCHRRTVLNKSYPIFEDRVALLKVNKVPIEVKRTGKFNTKIFVSNHDWENYKLAGRGDGFNNMLTQIPITKECSDNYKYNCVPKILFDICENSDIREMIVNPEQEQIVNNYINILDLAYGVYESDGNINPLVYQVGKTIISRLKVKRNITKLIVNDKKYHNYSSQVIEAAILYEVRLNKNEIIDIVENVENKQIKLFK